MIYRVQTSLVLPATPEAVWRLLQDGPGHATWNPRLSFTGPLVAGAWVGMRVRLAGVRLWVPVRIDKHEPHQELSWTGGIAGVFVGHHQLRLHATPDDRSTVLDHAEEFEGAAVPWLFPRLRGELSALQVDLNTGLQRALAGDGLPSTS